MIGHWLLSFCNGCCLTPAALGGVGITGVPGVGKSTFIDALGTYLTSQDHRVAVLAVDPSSTVSGGSILGDKTRMPNLAIDDAAYIRPSPSSGSLGGVTRTTRETMTVVEAAGFDVVLVETVGVGQSETAVADMVDFFLVMMLPGAGDELQGIKKGVLELADALVVNKADGGNEIAAQRAVRDYRAALAMTAPANPNWVPPGAGGKRHRGHRSRPGVGPNPGLLPSAERFWELASLRSDQQVRWMWAMVEDRLRDRLQASPEVVELSDLIANSRWPVGNWPPQRPPTKFWPRSTPSRRCAGARCSGRWGA